MAAEIPDETVCSKHEAAAFSDGGNLVMLACAELNDDIATLRNQACRLRQQRAIGIEPVRTT